MSNAPMLFYSERCSHSRQIVETLKQLKKENLCRMICIDGVARDKLPSFLKSVPTLYVPETKNVFIGKDIYAYIAKPVEPRREIPTNGPTAQHAAPGAATPAGDYQAWSFGTAGGFSDSYSDWNNPAKFADDQLRYTFIGGGGSAPTQPEPATKQSYDGDKNGRNGDIEARMKELQKQRDNEFGSIVRK